MRARRQSELDRRHCVAQHGDAMPSLNKPAIVWFRDDLRLADHPALSAAVETGAPLICIFVLDQERRGPDFRPHGDASKWWLAQSLRALSASLKARDADLILRHGPAARVISDVAGEADAATVFWNKVDVASDIAVAADLAERLAVKGIAVHEAQGDLLVSPVDARTAGGSGPRVFTPFWRRLRARGDPPQPLRAPQKLRCGPRIVSERLEHWALEPTTPDWAGGLRETWTPGEAGAHARLDRFLQGAKGYGERRDFPDTTATSALSPHLRFGEITPRQVWHAARFAAERDAALASDIEKFLSELGWREFCRHLLFDLPSLAEHSLQHQFEAFPWRTDKAGLKAWTRGLTGYPIVDAGMRELWHTGVMHNRVRMIAASFLVKDLLIDWREGERWFWDTLVDADPGSNPGNWQWVAGCGADAAPYFRIFNPVLQGEKFDPNGTYVRRWVPELSKLPNELIHKPWTAAPLELASAAIELGTTYPHPIVDHKAARERALAALASIKRR